MNTALTNKLIANALPLAIGAALIIGAVWWISKKTIGAAVDTVGGALTGNNAITKDTPYEGAGIAGTLGSTVNKVLGGLPQAIGEGISSWFTPNVQPTGNLYYSVLFPDGRKHAIVDTSVDRAGYFTYQGTRYRLGMSRDNTRIAVAV